MAFSSLQGSTFCKTVKVASERWNALAPTSRAALLLRVWSFGYDTCLSYQRDKFLLPGQSTSSPPAPDEGGQQNPQHSVDGDVGDQNPQVKSNQLKTGHVGKQITPFPKHI